MTLQKLRLGRFASAVIAGAMVAGAVMVGCEGPNGQGDRGSVLISGLDAPPVSPGDIKFAGLVEGTSTTSHEACESGGKTYRHFTISATGKVAGREYFLLATVYPYVGPGAYELKPLPRIPMGYLTTPNPLVDESPSYPGFLNFFPKSDPGNAYGPNPAGGYRLYIAVEPNEQTGWFQLEMITLNQKGGSPAHLTVTGRFVCGAPFQVD